jgi:hypothetical protein
MDEDFQWGAYLEQAFSMVRAQENLTIVPPLRG